MTSGPSDKDAGGRHSAPMSIRFEEMLHMLKHPHVVQFFGISVAPPRVITEEARRNMAPGERPPTEVYVPSPPTSCARGLAPFVSGASCPHPDPPPQIVFGILPNTRKTFRNATTYIDFFTLPEHAGV